MPKGVPKYDGAFKKQIVEELREKGFSYREIAQLYEITGAHSLADWEGIYLEEEPEGLFIERRGRGSKGRPPKKLKPEIEEELMAAAAPKAMVLHCLPAYREQEITTEVFEAHAQEIFDEAENRLHAQKAILMKLPG